MESETSVLLHIHGLDFTENENCQALIQHLTYNTGFITKFTSFEITAKDGNQCDVRVSGSSASIICDTLIKLGQVSVQNHVLRVTQNPLSVPKAYSLLGRGRGQKRYSSDSSSTALSLPATSSSFPFQGSVQSFCDVYEKSIPFSHGADCVEYLQRFRADNIEGIRTEFKLHQGSIEFESEPSACVKLKATSKNAIDALSKRVSELLCGVHFDRIRFLKHGLNKYMKSIDFGRAVNRIEDRSHVLFSFDGAEENSRFKIEMPSRSRLVSSHLPSCGSRKVINLFTGDICAHEADAIVNSANVRLRHNDGLAAFMLKCAGSEMQKESDKIREGLSSNLLSVGDAVKTSSGLLTNTKSIIHAVGPSWMKCTKEGKVNEAEVLLGKAVRRCLEIANDSSLSSIAFPAISAGVHRVPSDIVAKVMVTAVDDYLASFPDSSLDRIDFVMWVNDDDNIRSFSQAVLQLLRPAEIFSGNCRSSSEEPRLVVEVRKGDITTEKVEGIVNSTANNLDMSSGLVSNAILRAAGPKLQEDCNSLVKKYGNLKLGEVRISFGHRLPAKHILHVYCNEETLDVAVVNCLEAAEKINLTSVAFPAIGTGTLGIAESKAAENLFSGIRKYFSEHDTSSIQKILVIVYDSSKLSAYNEALRQFSFPEKVALPNGCSVKVSAGNVLTDAADVVVVSRGVTLDAVVDADPVTKSDWEKSKRSFGSVGDFVKLNVSNLQCRKIYLVFIPCYDSSRTDNSQNISSAVKKALSEANSDGFLSVSIPAIGTGGLSYSNALCARAIFDAVQAFSINVASPSLKLIKVCIFDSHRMADFIRALHERFYFDPPASHTEPQASSSQLIKSFRPASALTRVKSRTKIDDISQTSPTLVTANVVGGSKRACSEGIKSLEDIVDQQCISKKYNGSLPNDFGEELRDIERDFGVALTVEELETGVCIVVEGVKSDVTEAILELTDKLSKKREEERKEELECDKIKQKLSWRWQGDDGSFECYGKADNRKLEMAYQENPEGIVTLALETGTHTINFNDMFKVKIDADRRRTINRLESTREPEVPQHWVRRNSADIPNRVQLFSQDLEYQTVSTAFSSTFMGRCTILSIARVESPALYLKYSREKNALAVKRRDEIAGGRATLEKELFHGTDEDNITQIITNGFNRSFAGTAAGKRFGAGVYFANTSAKSHEYTKGGRRTMFYAYVLIGLTCKGNSKIRQPPVIDTEKDKADNYDSTVDDVDNPKIFVSCYRDSMAYPAYIITYEPPTPP